MKFADDETRYEFIDRLTLPPGRYDLRWNARSSSAGRGGTVFTAIDVPDVSRAPVTLSGVILGLVAIGAWYVLTRVPTRETLAGPPASPSV